MLKKTIDHKLFEIFFDKLLIGLVIFFAGHVANLSIEKYKLSEAQRMAGASAFVESCQEIWSKIYEFESLMDRQGDFDVRIKLTRLYSKDGVDNTTEVKELKELVEKKQKDATNLINEKRFVIGENFAAHFFKYIGIVKARAEARSSTFIAFNEEAKISQDAVNAFDKQLASMRFSDSMAREYAISQIPH